MYNIYSIVYNILLILYIIMQYVHNTFPIKTAQLSACMDSPVASGSPGIFTFVTWALAHKAPTSRKRRKNPFMAVILCIQGDLGQ